MQRTPYDEERRKAEHKRITEQKRIRRSIPPSQSGTQKRPSSSRPVPIRQVRRKRRGYGWKKALPLLFSALLITAAIGCGIWFRSMPSSAHSGEDTLSASNGYQQVETGGNNEPDKPFTHPSATEATIQLSDEIASGYAVLIDCKTNEILASKEADTVIYPASMTKIMTLLVAYENVQNLSDTFVMTADIVNRLYDENASVAGFSVGEAVTIKDLLYGVILPSGADATCALAEYISGSEEGFVKLMNRKAEELGLEHTHFMNSSGLHHANHYSTPIEIAIILKAAMENSFCREVLTTYQYTTNSTQQHPDGLLLESTMFSRMFGNEAPDVTVIGGKTGYTLEARQCLASMAEAFDGSEYIAVTADGETKWDPIQDTIILYDQYIQPQISSSAAP